MRTSILITTLLAVFFSPLGNTTAHPMAPDRLAQLERSMAEAPEDAALYLRRGAVFVELGRWAEALGDYRKARELGDAAPDVEQAVELALGLLHLEAGEPQRALVALDRLLALRPDHLKGRIARARAYGKLGQAGAAADDLRQVVALASSPSPDLYLELVRALVAAGREEEALARADEGMRRLGSISVLQREVAALGPQRFPLSQTAEFQKLPARSGQGGFPCDDDSTGPKPPLARGPYLQQAHPTGLTVRWSTGSPADSQVLYGPDPSKLSFSAYDGTLTTQHEVALSGLEPETPYFYSVGSSSQVLAGGDREHFFRTPPTTGSRRPTRLWVIGDSGSANLDAASVRDAFDAFNGRRYVDLWLMLGDNAYPDGKETEYQAAVFDFYPARLRQTVLWSTLGNHDGHCACSATQQGPYYDIFTLPTQGEAGGVASSTEAYYSFDHGNIHFISLDSYDSDRSPGSAMVSWLEDDLAATDADWLIAFWHHPPYSKGSHDSDKEALLIEMRETVLPLLEDYGVDLVLAGHSHSYERSFLLDSHYDTSDTLLPTMVLDDGDGRLDGDDAYRKLSSGGTPHEGAVYVVAGSSGRITAAPLDHPAMFLSMSRLGSLVLDIDGERLDGTFLQEDGTIGDTFTILKGDLSQWIFADGFDSGDASLWSRIVP